MAAVFSKFKYVFWFCLFVIHGERPIQRVQGKTGNFLIKYENIFIEILEMLPYRSRICTIKSWYVRVSDTYACWI